MIARATRDVGAADPSFVPAPPLEIRPEAHDLKILVPDHNFGCTSRRRTFADSASRGLPQERDPRTDFGWAAEYVPAGSDTVFLGHGSLRPAGSSYAAVEPLSRQLSTQRPQTIVAGDLLQRLEDPRPLLRALRGALQINRDNRVIVTLFDPSLPGSDGGANLASAEASSIRLWTGDQARSFFRACGFVIAGERPLAPAEARDSGCNYAFALSCSEQHYRGHLARHRLPPVSVEYLLFATEHSACKITGGIGAYVEQMEKLLPREKFALCYVGDPEILPGDAAEDRAWILPSLFLDRDEWCRLKAPDLALLQLQALTFLYPGLECVEFQEYLAIGHLANLAKRAGLLPGDLTIKTRCHGSQIYLESCFSRWTIFEHLEIAYQEKVAIEQADVVSVPSRFLLEMYRSKGYRIDDSRVEIRKYPFEFHVPLRPESASPIDTLLFFGKRTRMKGFPSFVEALSRLTEDPLRRGIQRAVVIGRIDPTLEEENRRLAELKSRIEIVEFEGPRTEALALIERHAASGLCAMPYQSDNHPMAVLEAASTGCAFVAASTGGIPEMIPQRFHRPFLYDPSREKLYDACVRILSLVPEERRSLIGACLEGLREAYRAVNAEHLQDRSRRPRSFPGRRNGSTIGVIVPCYNSKLEHIRDLVYGLNEQTRPPDEICFVDDGSREGFASELAGFLSQYLAAPFRIVKHEVNRGLAGARNTGLRNLGTEYVVNIDSDDIPKPEFVADYINYLDRDPEAVAVTSWLESFRDGTNWLEPANCFLIYKPLGDGLVLAQTQNCLGHANSAFRRDHLLSLGGWDESDKSMWEDWALFLRIVCAGQRIGVVPKSNILYRVNEGSMARTHAKFPAMNRLARNMAGLPRFESFRLQGVLRGYEDLRRDHEVLRQEHEHLRNVHSQVHTNLNFRIARKCAALMDRHPRLKGPLKKLLLLVEGSSRDKEGT